MRVHALSRSRRLNHGWTVARTAKSLFMCKAEGVTCITFQQTILAEGWRALWRGDGIYRIASIEP
jgi:hypothetical protein